MPRIAACLVPSPEHFLPGHPEAPNRFSGFPELLARFGPGDIARVEPRGDPAPAVARVHPLEYLQRLAQAAREGPSMIDPAPTYVVPASYPAARLAVAGALAVLEEVRSGKADAGLALVRPPGHHALADQAMGFCLMNNVAILTRAAQSFGWGRVMIVDFDVHHGNGTQAIFEGDPDVLFVSTHQSGIYPGTGDWTETGIGAAAGCTVNIPLPAGAGDVAFESIASRLLRPLCQRHRPNLLLVSAGFDAHWRDPLAGLQVSLRGYYELSLRLVEMAREFTDGRLVFVTEGGYDPTVMTEGVSAVIAALLELPSFADRLGPAPGPEPTIGEEISRIAALHGI